MSAEEFITRADLLEESAKIRADLAQENREEYRRLYGKLDEISASLAKIEQSCAVGDRSMTHLETRIKDNEDAIRDHGKILDTIRGRVLWITGVGAGLAFMSNFLFHFLKK